MPPKPPNSSCSIAPTPAMIPDDVLNQDLRQLAAHTEVIATLKNKCILCVQQVKATGHIKKHWQSSHPKAWTAAHQDAESAAGSLRATFTRPCQYCGSTAKQGYTDATHHATKCSSLFQVLGARRLRRAGLLHDSMHEVRGPALKQTEKGRQYKTSERMNIMSLLKGTRVTRAIGSMPSQQADSLRSASKVSKNKPPLPAREEAFASAGSASLLGPPGH